MKIKQILFSIFIFAATHASAVENIDRMNPIVFTLNAEKASACPDELAIFKKIPGGKYNFETIAPDKFEQYIGKPCVACPLLRSIIVDSDNPDQCDPLGMILLSARVTALEELNKNMAKMLVEQSQFNLEQVKFNQAIVKMQQYN